jgi:DNA topoisomerase-1
LEHAGPLFAPPYVPLPPTVTLRYNGQAYKLSPPAEEVAGFYATMLHSEYPNKAQFNKNFMSEWRGVMTAAERAHVTDLGKCDFTVIQAHYTALSEARKAATKEDKTLRKEAEAKVKAKYGWALLNGHRQKIGNFRIEPPGLFRGRGEHPKMGLLKHRLQPEDVIINVSDVKRAPAPPEGHAWKEVRSDNTVTWLASWTENVGNGNKYIMFSSDSYLKGQNDLKKYETARQLKANVDRIRACVPGVLLALLRISQ